MKSVKQILSAPPQHWVGNGFHVFPVFHDKAFTAELSPWLMFDYAAPKEFSPLAPGGARRGVGQHPHRGFETVTLAFQGEVEHGDSVGNRGVIAPGDVQWMTAARGIIHEEFHSDEFSARGGTFEMAQLWVNLPKRDKMGAPRYQPITAADIPTVALVGAAAGGADDDPAAAEAACGAPAGNHALTHSPVELFDVHLAAPDVPVELAVPDGHNLVVFVRAGAARIGAPGDERAVGPQGVALMQRAGTTLRLSAAAPDTRLLLLGGAPLDEPIAARGPFVMNTREELAQANADFRSGRMGT